MKFKSNRLTRKILATLLAFLIIFTVLGSSHFAKTIPVAEAATKIGYASTAPYANPDYRASVGDEVVAEDINTLLDAQMIELVAEDGTVYTASEVADGRLYFDEIPVGDYTPRLTEAAKGLGYGQATPDGFETTLTVSEGDSRVYAGSVGLWFAKVKTGYASTAPYANPDYKASVGDEVVAEDINTLLDAQMIELVATEDGTVYTASEVADGRLYFDEIPVGDYTPRLTEAAKELGYEQATPEGYETTLTVSEGGSRVYAGSVGLWFSKKIENTTPAESTETENTTPTESTAELTTQPTTSSNANTTEKIILSNNTTTKSEENKATPKTGEMSMMIFPFVLVLSAIVLLIIKHKEDQID